MMELRSRIRGGSAAACRLREQVKLYAQSPANVLVEGETGTGKELIARALHAAGPRCDQPFVAVDCGAIVAELFESELFGHVRGSFTGAHQDRRGLLSAAAGGTLFLDEVENLPPAQQSKVLRALEEREFRPVGTDRTCRFEARLVAATNRDLRGAAKAGEFREDLLFRLEVLRIDVPPLRARLDDLPELLESLAGNSPRFEPPAPELLNVLRSRAWRGNIRELGNCVERALAIAPVVGWSEAWQAAICGSRAGAASPGAPVGGRAVDEVGDRTQRLERALARNGWHRGATAADLGISRATLWRHMRQLGIGGSRVS